MATSPSDSLPTRPGRRRRRFLTVRSLLIGCVMALVIGLAEPYLTIYLSSSYLFTDYHSGGASFLILVLFVVFNLGLGSLWKRFALETGEMLFVVAMMFAAGSIVTSGGVTHLIPLLSSAFYYASPANQWHQEIVPYVKSWMAPLDPGGGTVAIEKFWEGLPAGEPIPWGPWVQPVLLWGLYLMVVFGCMAAIMVLMRKQWVEHEHLSYPIAQVPAEVCSAAGAPLSEDSIFRSKVFWLGLGFTFVGHSLLGVRYYLTGVAGRFRIDQVATLAEGYELRFWVEIVVIGLVFLIPNRVAFSVWTFALVAWLGKSIIKQRGLGMQQNMTYGGPAEMQHMVMGALLVFVVASLWYARQHLWRAVRCALGLGERDYDRHEPTSYRTAFLTLFFGLIFIFVWLRRTGLHLHWAALFVAAFFAVYYGMARIIAQVGLPSASTLVSPAPWVVSTFGASTVGQSQIVPLGYQFWNADLRQTAIVGTAHGMYLAGRRRGLFWSMLLALGVAYGAAALCTIWTGYRQGASNLSAWFIVNSSKVPWWWAIGTVTQNEGPSLVGMSWAGAGAAIMAALTIAQRTLFWWPLHPIAFLISHTHMVYNFWFSIFLAWLIKVFVVRFGGYGAYRKARRFFIGMVLGGFLGGGIWAVIDLIARATGNQVFAI